MAQNEQTWSDEYQTTLISQMPQLTTIFKELAAGITPNPLQMIAALSEVSVSQTDHDILERSARSLQGRMSRKKCLFCS